VGQAKPQLDLDTAIGGRIRDLRKAAKIRPAEAAAKMNLSISDYELSERGMRRFRATELFNIAQCLGVGMSDIFGVVDQSGSVQREIRPR
jgi:transcriptional regulator with XRE-family HTH domain